jgi:hypothetical protein
MPKGIPLRLTEATMALLKSDKADKEVAAILGIATNTVSRHRCEFVGRRRDYVKWPTDPTWYEVRTMPEICEALNTKHFTAWEHVKKHGYTYRKGRWATSLFTGKRPKAQWHRPLKYNYPASREFWEARTAKQMAAIIGCTRVNANQVAAKRGYVLKKEKRRVAWPTDASWYAERTAHEIAGILSITDDQVYLHARKHGYKTKQPAMSTYDWRYENKNSYKNARRG